MGKFGYLVAAGLAWSRQRLGQTAGRVPERYAAGA